MNPVFENTHSQYLQKSKIFLYPLLGIARRNNSSLINTFLGFGDDIKPEHTKLIALHYQREDAEFKSFETRFLLGNPLFSEVCPFEDNKKLYIFDFGKDPGFKADFQHVVAGKYSKLTPGSKQKILEFYSDRLQDQMVIQSFLNPEGFKNIYADRFTLNRNGIDTIKKALDEVGELCSKPDLQRETLILRRIEPKEMKFSLSLSGNQQ